MQRFDGKNILVVGSSSGIGLSAAQRLAQEGATIVGVGRDMVRLESAIGSLAGTKHICVTADVTDEKQMDLLVQAGKSLGGYDGGVFCAGYHTVRPLSVCKSEDLLKSYSANVLSSINCTKALSKAVNKNGASIVWLSSVAAAKATAGFIAYSAAKGALISAARVAAVELVKKKIRINVISAGVVQTPMSESWLSLLSAEQRDQIANNHILGIGHPDDVSGVIAFLLSDDSRWMTGSNVVVDGGLSIV